VQAGKPAKGKRKAPEPAEEEDSEEDDLSSEDEPVPGEEDPEDSNESDEDVLEQDSAEDSADDEESDEGADAPIEPGKPASRALAGKQQHGRAQQISDPVGDGVDESDEEMEEGAPLTIMLLSVLGGPMHGYWLLLMSWALCWV